MCMLYDDFFSVGSLYYLSNIHNAIAPIIMETIRKRKKTTVRELIEVQAPFRVQEPCYVNGSTEILLGGNNWKFYAQHWSLSRVHLLILFKDGRTFKVVRASEGKFNYGWRLAASTMVRLNVETLLKARIQKSFFRMYRWRGRPQIMDFLMINIFS